MGLVSAGLYNRSMSVISDRADLLSPSGHKLQPLYAAATSRRPLREPLATTGSDGLARKVSAARGKAAEVNKIQSQPVAKKQGELSCAVKL